MFSIVFASRENERRPQMGDWLKPHQRAPLEKARLIELEKDGRAQRVILTDAGWAWAAANLNAGLPRRNWAARVLQDVLTRLGPHLHANDAALAQFVSMPSENDQIGSRPLTARDTAAKNAGKPVAREPAAKKADPKKKATKKPVVKQPASSAATAKKAKKKPVAKESVSSTATPKKKAKQKLAPKIVDAKQSPAKKPAVKNVDAQPPPAKKPTNSHRTPSERIRLAALELAGGQPRTRVRLRDLRARLDDVPRAQLDRELMELQRKGSLVLYRIDDPTDVTKDDELAALQVAGFPRHILYLES